jgi:Methylamine dehydrogenase heavy chain (MADH)
MKPYRIRDIRQPLSLGARTLARGLWRGAAVTGVIAALLLSIGFVENIRNRKSGNLATSPHEIAGIGQNLVSGLGPVSFPRGQRPAVGSLYVIDFNSMKKESQILVVDPEHGNVIRTFKSGYYPDMALSHDGTRLYIASTYLPVEGGRGKGRLEVVDTATGVILQTAHNPNRWVGARPLYQSHMAISPDDRWLYVLQFEETRQGDVFSIVTFDTAQGRFLPDKAVLDGCTSAIMLPLSQGRQLDLVCTGSRDVRFLKLSESGGVLKSSCLSLRYWSGANHGQSVGPALMSSDGHTLTVMMGDGRFFRVNHDTEKIDAIDGVDSASRKEIIFSQQSAGQVGDDWLTGRWMRFQAPVTSPDQRTLYVGLGRLEDLRHGKQSFDQILVLDGQGMARKSTISTSAPLRNFGISRDGHYLYGVAADTPDLLVIDTESNHELRKISNVGVTPSFLIVAP